MTILENMSLADNKENVYGLKRGVNKNRTEYYRELLRPLNLGLEDKMHVKVGISFGRAASGDGSTDVHHDAY